MTIQPIVEGHGEIEAVPVLLRRLRDLAQAYPLEVNAPIRRHYSDFFDETELRKIVRLALKQPCNAVLLVVDGDARRGKLSWRIPWNGKELRRRCTMHGAKNCRAAARWRREN
jgi:hypothetical protein